MNFNRVIIGGRLTRDPEVRELDNDQKVANVGIAVNSYRRSGDDYEQEGHFFDAEAWGNTANTLKEYFAKGSAILIEGELRQDRWQDDNGNNRSKVKIRIQKIIFMPRERQVDDDESDSDSDGAGSDIPDF